MASFSEVLGTIGAAIAPFNPVAGGIAAGVGQIAGLIGGSTTSVTAISPGLAGQQAAAGGGFPVSTGTSVGPTVFGPPIGANLGGAVPQIIRGAQRILPALGAAAAAGAVGQVGSSMLLGPAPAPRTMTQKQFILATARAFQPGATAKKIIRSARECGIELAAATFGLDVLQVCFLISQPPTRRRRGISAADIRRTRSTMRKINSLKNMCPPARRRK